MNNYSRVLTITLVMLFNLNAIAQKKQVAKFQYTIAQAVKKAYSASVRMWGFDVQQNQRTSGQFSGVVVSADGYILTAAHTILPGWHLRHNLQPQLYALPHLSDPSAPEN